MSTIAHMLSGAYLGVIAGQVTPSETNYIFTALIAGGIPDLDHIYYIVKDWGYYKKNGFVGNLHKARSIFHELIGFTSAGVVMLALSFFDLKLAFVTGIPIMIHLIEDILMGRSMPFSPVDKTEITIVPQKKSIKIIVDILVIIIFSILWLQYLKKA